METGAALDANYQLEFGEFYRAMRWYAWKRYWWLWTIVIVMATMQLIGWTRSKDPSSELSARLTAIAIPIFLIGFFHWSIYYGARRQFKTNNSLQEIRRSTITVDGIESSSSSSSWRTAWTTFHKVVESPELFLFFTSSAAFLVIPKRGFGNEDRVQALRDLIRQKLGAKAKLKK